MKNILLLFIALFGIHTTTHAKEKEDVDYILILNSINFNEVKTRLLFETIRDEFSSEHLKVINENLGLKLSIQEEALAVPSVQTMEEANHKLHHLKEKYMGQRKPLVLLFIGDPGWLMCKPLFDDMWKDVPTVISMARDCMAPDFSIMLDKNENRLETELRPTEEVIKPYNAVALKQPVFIKETVELMHQLMPELNEITFISDQRYISLFTRIEMKNTIKNFFPKMKLRELTSPKLSTQNLLDSLSVSDKNSGIIYFSWFVSMPKGVDTYLEDNIQTIVSAFSKTPVFTLADLNPTNGNFAGGHYINVNELAKTCINVLYNILKGKRPQDMSVMMGGEPATILSYPYLTRYNIPEKLFPENAVYLQKPPTFFEKYQWTFLAFIIILSLIVIIILMRIRSFAVKQRAREREIQLLEENKMFLEDLFNHLPVSIAVRDIQNQMRFLFWNKKSEKTFNISQEDIMNHPNEALASSKIAQKMDKDDQEVLKDGKQISDLRKFEDRDGKIRYLYVNKRIISHQDGKKWLLCTTWDMTEQQKNQEIQRELNERMQMIIKASRMNIWTYNILEGMLYYNNDYNIGIEEKIQTNEDNSPETTFTINIWDVKELVYFEDKEHVAQKLREFIEEKTCHFDEEFRIYNSYEKNENNISWIRSYATILKRDAQNKPTILIGATTNVDDRKKIENSLREAKLMAEEISRLKDVFLANMSHEIRTPLNAIVGFSGILADTDSPEEKQEYVSIIQNNTELLLQLINDILDLSKIEAGTLEFVYKEMNVKAMFTELATSSRVRMNNPEVEIIFEESSPELVLWIDSNRLMQVMNNFMTNAMKFTRRGSIRFGYRQKEDGNWYFYLTDTGEGIPAEKLDSIFERFVKLDSFKQGTGLGLSICKSIIDKFGGTIGADSQQGVGSTFWFVIPDMRCKIK